MAVDVKFSVCQTSDCKSIKFTEKTGLYDAVTNLTGWDPAGGGGPNDETADATIATLTITSPDGVVYAPVDLFNLDGFPKSTEDSYTIAASAVDSSLTDFKDGRWKMTYSVTTPTATYEETITFFFHCKIDSCICKKLAALDVNDCDCDPGKIEEVLKMKAFADSLEYAVGCGNLNAADDILTTLEKLCGC